MLDYLVERENEEMFRTSVRDLDFPDGITRSIETYRLVWTWFDRACVYEHGYGEQWILAKTLDWSAEKQVGPDEALGQLLNFMIKEAETIGVDYTDDHLPLTIARQAVERFDRRKSQQ